MSLLDNQTKINQTSAFYGTGGGGGGGGSVITVSTISGPSVSTPVNVGPAGLYVYTNGFGDENSGFEVYKGGGNTTNALADYDTGAAGQGAIGVRGYSTIGGNQVIDNLFTITTDTSRNTIIRKVVEYAGISTISQMNFNADGSWGVTALPGAAGGAGTGITCAPTASTITFLPQGAIACHSKVAVSTNTYVPQAGTTQFLGSFPSVVGNLYDVRLPVRIDSVSQPTAGDWCVITTDTATAPVALATFELAQVSTVGNQYEMHICGSVAASATTTNIIALGKPGAGTSTAITVAGSAAAIRNLGLPVAP
jgi:hypothetical protein